MVALDCSIDARKVLSDNLPQALHKLAGHSLRGHGGHCGAAVQRDSGVLHLVYLQIVVLFTPVYLGVNGS